MWYIVGIMKFVAGIAVGVCISLLVVGDTAGLVAIANLAALFLFLGAINIILSPSHLSAFGNLFNANMARKRWLLALIGGAIGLCIGGLFNLSLIYSIPIITFIGLSVILLLIDFFLVSSPRWAGIRQSLVEDLWMKFMAAIIAGAINTVIYGIVLASWWPIVLLPAILSPLILIALIDLIFPSSRIWAVARHMIAEGIRMKIALVFIGLIVIILPVMPFAISGDGVTLTSRVQSFLSYSLGSVGFLLSLLTVFLSCGSLANEIQMKQILMVVSKPIPRWHFFVGKWLGIGVLNGVILLMTGLTIWGCTWYLQSRPTNVLDDRETLEFEVLNVRHGIKPQEPNFAVVVEDRLRRLQEEGRLSEMAPSGQETLQERLYKDLKIQWRTLVPGEFNGFIFSNLLVNREDGGYVHLHFKPTTHTGVSGVMFRARWMAGDPQYPNTMTNEQVGEFICGRFHKIILPTYAVNPKGTLYLGIQNIDPREIITFEGDDSLELLYGIGTFHWNLARALTIVWCRLAFLALLGLLASSFLSFPVACLVCLLVLVVASFSGFLAEAIEFADVSVTGEDPLWILGPILRPLGKAFVWVVPDFSKYNAISNVVSGRVVPLKWVLISIWVLILLKGLILGVLGCVILTKRELAQIVV
ncbi:MAG: ABC transporter permease [Planctomycetota bacterium]|jgi:hypothetical protein